VLHFEVQQVGYLYLCFALLPIHSGFISSLMPMRCPKCGAEVEDTWPVCRKCFEPVKRPGMLSRLLRAFRSRFNISVSASSTAMPGFDTRTLIMHTNQSFKIRDATTGEMREYHSLDDVPEPYREQLRQAQQAALSQDVFSAKRTTKITWTDSSGTTHHCNSLDELPPQIRALYEKAMGGEDKNS
jgi:hypothetical protein